MFWVEIGEFFFGVEVLFLFLSLSTASSRSARQRSSKMDCVRENVEDRDAGRRWEVVNTLLLCWICLRIGL